MPPRAAQQRSGVPASSRTASKFRCAVMDRTRNPFSGEHPRADLFSRKSAPGVCIMRCALTRWLLASALPPSESQVLGGVSSESRRNLLREYCEAALVSRTLEILESLP